MQKFKKRFITPLSALAFILSFGANAFDAPTVVAREDSDSDIQAELLPEVYVNPIDLRFLKMRIPSKLNSLKPHFLSAAKKYQLPWQLLAGLAYQESQWVPTAKSYTGVKGIMMLTLDTAKWLGIRNRENPSESIEGGAKYLRFLLDEVAQIHPLIPAENRLRLALAAYNMGLGNLNDAMRLAFINNKDPFHWDDLKEFVLKLKEPELRDLLPYGGARGDETVKFVGRVVHFYEELLTYPFRSSRTPKKPKK
jgi:membrane-bound lytic murein transglycosylase F